MKRKILFSLILTPIIYLFVAGGLIASQQPQVLNNEQDGLDFTGVLSSSSTKITKPQHIQMRDGYSLPVRLYGEVDKGPLIIMVHGSGWHGMQFDQLATKLSEIAYIAVPDMRGHGETPERRGDIDHIGQYEEDIADLIDTLRYKEQKIIVLGHSSGGGFVTRMAGGQYGDYIDYAILLAPYLKYNAPTMQPNSGGWTHALTRRLIGLSMLNNIGITIFNDLTVIQLAMPKVILEGPLGHTATIAYSYRLNTSYAPRNEYLSDVAKLPKFQLIVGSKDEAFIAEEYEPLMRDVTDFGTYHIVQDIGHLDIVNANETPQLIKQYLQGL